MLLSCGDALIDFIPERLDDGRDALLPTVGGSCLNIAVGMARLGAPAGFVGGIATDFLGQMIAAHAVSSNVTLRYATRGARQTTLAFVRMVDGEPHYAFYDEGTASRHWSYRKGSISFADIDAVHVGSTTLIHEETATQTYALLADAQGAATVSFDPNCRPNLISEKKAYVKRMESFAAHADIVRMSDVDFAYMYESERHEAKARQWLAHNASLVIITRGERGVTAWHCGAGAVEVAAPRVTPVDTVGAGDSFQAALLVGLRMAERIAVPSLRDMTADELKRILTFAAACAARTCERAGANPPSRAELDPGLFALLRPSAA
jgi:fructokinase